MIVPLISAVLTLALSAEAESKISPRATGDNEIDDVNVDDIALFRRVDVCREN